MEGLCDYMKKFLFLHIAFNIVVVRAVAVERCLVQCLLSRWVGYRDNQASALLKALAVEVYCAILSNKPVDVVTGSNNTCTLGKGICNL